MRLHNMIMFDLHLDVHRFIKMYNYIVLLQKVVKVKIEYVEFPGNLVTRYIELKVHSLPSQIISF